MNFGDMVEIKDISGKTRFSTPINKGAKGKFTLMKEDYIILPFSVQEPVYFKVGDYIDLSNIEFEGLGGKVAKVYEIIDINNVSPTYNESTGAYDYNIRLDAYYWKWKNKIFKYTPENAGQEASWSLTAALDVHLGVLLRNLKALGYTYKGTEFTFSIDSTVENKAVAVTYDNTNLLDALFMLAGESYYNCDCWITDNVIHFGRNEFGDAVKIERGVEALSIGKAESKGTYATRIYAFGGTRNIPTNYRPTEEQTVVNGVVQKRLMLPKGTPYIDAYTGMTTEEAIEDVVVFDDVYPRRIGTMSDITTVDRDIVDGGETVGTFKAYQYKDLGLNFSEDYIIDGQELKIRFQSGKLNGLEFSVQFNPNGEDPAELLWEIVRNEDYGRPLPDDVMKPESGDTYVLSGFDIQLVSDQYIPEAEQELLERAKKYAEMAKKDDGTYPVTLFSDFVYSDQLRHNYEFGQKVNLIDKAYFPEGRISRILGWEINLDIPYDSPKYTVGESMPYSRIGELEQKIDALTYKGQTYTGSGGGSGVYVIRTNDSTAASDSNVFSALRSLAMFLRKDKADETKFLLRLLGGAITDNLQSQNFASGAFGSGYLLKRDPKTGKSYMEIDEIYVRLKAYFDTLEVKHLSHVGGRVVLSPASMECNRVEIVTTGFDELYDIEGSQLYDIESSPLGVTPTDGELVYRCYFNNSDEDIQIVNEFAVNDLAQCREFNIKEGTSSNVSNQYYWRRVVAVGDNYIDLSITDCDEGSSIPKAGDTIVTIGNTTDKNRQNVVYLSSYDDDAPSIKLYSGINSYSMLNKEVTVISPNADKNLFTGKVVIKAGSEGFKNFADAPDLDAITEDIQSAKDAAQNAVDAADAVSGEVSNLNDYVNGAFKDGIITQTENNAIATYINIINNSKAKIEASYLKLFANPYLHEGTEKTNLEIAYNRLNQTTNSLLSRINEYIADGLVTDAEKELVDGAFDSYNTESSNYEDAVEAANEYIQNILKQFSDEASRQASEAASAASNAASAASEVKQDVSSLGTYVDGAFKDGVISSAEAKAIEKYINQINGSKKEVDATYQVLVNNPYLMDSTALQNMKIRFDGAVEGLINEINKAIADGKTTTTEAQNVNMRFGIFNSEYALLCTEIENANKAIQEKIKEIAVNESVSESKRIIGQVSDEYRNDLAQKMGYTDYSQMLSKWQSGETVIKGGVINTKLIEAEAIITSALIANAIKAQSLNINDNFLIDKEGNAIIGGNARFLGNIETYYQPINFVGTPLETDWYRVDKYLNILASFNVELPSDITYEGKRILITNIGGITPSGSVEKVPAEIRTQNGLQIYGMPLSEQDLSQQRRAIKIQFKTGSFEFVAISNGQYCEWIVTSYSAEYVNTVLSEPITPTVYTINGNVTPTNAGQIIGVGSRIAGTVDTITAEPKSGWSFSRWSDGITTASREVVWDRNKTYTAEFIIRKFIISGTVSPEGYGVIEGLGSYDTGANVRLRAVSANNAKYIFSQWGDGDKSDTKNITVTKDENFTAFFNEYTKPEGNIFVIGAETTQLVNLATILPPTETLAWVKALPGSEFSLVLGVGSLTGKIQQNMHLTLSFTINTSNASGSVYYLYGLGTQTSTKFDDISQEGTVSSLTQLTESQSISIDLWTARTALSTDGLFIALSGLNVNEQVFVRDIKLELFSI